MKSWQEMVESKLELQKYKVAEISLENRTVHYLSKIKHNRILKSLTGDEEVVRASLLDRLVNELDYKPENLETEKEYTIKGGHSKITPRIDILVKDDEGNPFFFIEAKSPQKFELDKKEIEGQLFALAQAEERDFKTKVKYLVYYTTELIEEEVVDRAIIIDFEKYPTFSEWEKEGSISTGTEITAGYGEPKKQPLVKGDEKNDLRVRINRNEIDGLGRNLHDVLWGGGGTNDSEIFYSLVNIILAKIQDEYEKEDGQEYDFQVYKYGNNVETTNKIYERVNNLYKRALREQMNVTDEQKIADDNVINRIKFPLNKLVYTVQALESFSFLAGRSSLDGKDILGDFFESITRDGFKQNKGQFFTPTPIVNFLLYALQLDNLAINKLNNDRGLPLIIDPSAGSGTYLVEAMKIITREVKYKQNNKVKTSKQIIKRFEELFIPDYNENKWAKEYLYGSEINFDLGTASKVNMILHGDGSTNIFVQDGLLPFRFYEKGVYPNYLETSSRDPLYDDKEVNGMFDVVVSNPPFSVDLDTQTQREVLNTFLFGDKKNSENLFIERYYQLLKEGGRLGVVLPESVFDTTENKYIRLFLFKFFNIKAVISLPQLTFEPYTSTKTSILFAQKKTKAEVEQWNLLWHRFGNEWSLLKTRINDYNQYFVEGKKLNNRWATDVVKDIKEDNKENILNNIYRFLKEHISEEDTELEINEILNKYREEIISLSKYEKESSVFGFYNAWWVFGEISEELDYKILMAEAENVGYKRSKKGEKRMPNDLYDLEYAPNTLDSEKVLSWFDTIISDIEKSKEKYNDEKILLQDIVNEKENEKNRNNLNKVVTILAGIERRINKLNDDKSEVEGILERYYENNKLKDEYMERDNVELIHHFKKGVLSPYRSEDILLRNSSNYKILDAMRQEVVWD